MAKEFDFEFLCGNISFVANGSIKVVLQNVCLYALCRAGGEKTIDFDQIYNMCQMGRNRYKRK